MSEIILMLYRSTPSKKNSRQVNRKTGRNFPSKAYQVWEKESILDIRNQWGNANPLASVTEIEMSFTFGTKRRCDLDNRVSSILDMLVKAAVLLDDNWQAIPRLVINSSYDKGIESAKVVIKC